MVITKKHDQPENEKQWKEPLNPEKAGDDRDREQVERQIKEAKRRHDNLTETDTENKEQN